MKKLFLNIVLALFFVSVLYPQNISGIKIGVVHSAKTKQMLHKDDNQFNPIQNWELFFLNRKIPYTVFSDEEIDDNDFTDTDVLILPSVEVLSPDAKENLLDFVNEGKGLIILGEIGSYNEDGKKSKGNFINDLCGFLYYQLETQGEIAERHTITANSFLSRGIPFSAEITIINRFAPLYARVKNDEQKLGKYILKNENDNEKSGIVAVSKGKGRVVWFGFSLSQISAEDDIVEKIIFNSIEWLSDKPFLQLAPMFRGDKVPVVISNLIKDPNQISDELLNELYSDSIKSNFFIEASSLPNSGNKLGKLSATGDINLSMDLFDINNRGVDKDSLLKSSFEFLSEKSRQKYFGVKIVNLYGNLSGINFSPFQYYMVTDQLVLNENGKQNKLLTMANKFSFSFRNSVRELNELKVKIENVRKEKQVLFLSLLNQGNYTVNSDLTAQIKIIADYLKSTKVLLLSYSELIDRLLKREDIALAINRTEEKNQFLVTVENKYQENIKDVVIELIVHSGNQKPEIINTTHRLTKSDEPNKYLVTIPYLHAGMKEIFKIKFEEK